MKRGRPSSLSRELILAAAQNMKAETLSFSLLAESLGVADTSLYHYFSNLEDIQSSLRTKVLTEVEFLDNHPIGDFSSYLIRFLTDYRDWLDELSLDPSIFQTNFCAVSFVNGGNAEPLYVRLEDFLETANAEGIELAAAMKIWFAITDFMSRSLSVDLPDSYLETVTREMRSVTEKADPEQFPLIQSYLDDTTGAFLTARACYDFLVRSFVRGLLAELGLDQSPAPAKPVSEPN
ncbi:MAG: TetR/AcrR family transcriptional regulator [Myxococcota bacterium]|nr:TetR/AcrR family transcriptional regulator [Myxococcota bacterium]